MRCISPFFRQEEMRSKNAYIETMVTSKEGVMEGDPKFTNLIEARVYDTNPVHYTGMVSEELKWFIKEKECFNFEMGKVKK